MNILINGIKINKEFIMPFIKEKNKLKSQNKEYEEYNYFYGWKFKLFKEGLEKNNLDNLNNNIKQSNNNILICFINDSLEKANDVIKYLGTNFPKSDLFIIFLTISQNITKRIFTEYIDNNNIDFDPRNLDLIYYNHNDISSLFKILFLKSCYFNQLGNDMKVPDINKNVIEKNNKEKYSFNILVTGRPGAGKSTFINIMNGVKCAKEGDNEKKRNKKILQYYLENTNIVLYDTPGIQDSQDLEIFNKLIEEEVINMNLNKEKFNCIIYMINNDSNNYFNNTEISFINKLLEFGTPIYILINQSYMKNDIIKRLIEEKIKITFTHKSKYIKVFNVNLLINQIKIKLGVFINKPFGLDELFYDIYRIYKSYGLNQLKFNNDYSLIEKIKINNNNLENLKYFGDYFSICQDYIYLDIQNKNCCLDYINNKNYKNIIFDENMVNQIISLYMKEFNLNKDLFKLSKQKNNIDLIGLNIPGIKKIFSKIKFLNENLIKNYRQNENNLRNYYDEKKSEDEKNDYLNKLNIYINSTINIINKEKDLSHILNYFDDDNNDKLLNILINDYYSIFLNVLFINTNNKAIKKNIKINIDNYENNKKFFNLIINIRKKIIKDNIKENNKNIITQLAEIINWVESYLEEISLIHEIFLKLSIKIPKLFEKIELMLNKNIEEYENSSRNNKYSYLVNKIFYIIINTFLSIIISDYEIYKLSKEDLNILININKEVFKIILQLENDLSLNIKNITTLKIFLELIDEFNKCEITNYENIIKILKYFNYENEYNKDSKRLCHNFNKFYDFLNERLGNANVENINIKILSFIILNEYNKYPLNEFRLLSLEKILEKNDLIRNSSQIIKLILDTFINSKPKEILYNLEKIKNDESPILSALNDTQNPFLEEIIMNIFEGKINIYFDLIKELDSNLKQKLYPKYFKDTINSNVNETGIIFDNSLNIFKQCIQFLDKFLNNNYNKTGNINLCKLYSIVYIKIYLSKAVLMIKEKYKEMGNSEDIIKVIQDIENKNFEKVLKIYIFKNFYYLLDNNYEKFKNYNYKEKGIYFFKDFPFTISDHNDNNINNNNIKENNIFLLLDNDYKNYNEALNIFKNIQNNNFVGSTEIIEKLIEKNGFDMYLVIAINNIISNLPHICQKDEYINFCSFSNSLIKKEWNNDLIKLLFLFFDYKTYNEKTKQIINDKYNDKELFKILLYGFRYCINTMNNNNEEGIFLFKDLLTKDINNTILQSFIPGIDIKEDLHITSLESINYHFNNLSDSYGCYVCSCGFYYCIAPSGFPTINVTAICPECGLKIGWGPKKVNIGRVRNHGMVIRPGHYRLFRDKKQKEGQMKKWLDSDENIPNLILEDYIKQVIEPIEKQKNFGFILISKEYFLNQNKKIRNLSNIGYRLLNFISYCHLFYSYCMGSISEENMKKNIIQSMNIHQVIQNDWNLLKESLKEKNIQSIDIFMSMIFKELSILIKECKYISKYEELVNFENQVEILIDKYIKKYPEYNVNFNKEKLKDTGIEAIISELIERDSEIFEEKEYPMMKYFYYTKFKREDDFMKHMDKNRQYPLIKQLLIDMPDNKKMKYLPIFNEFSNLMIKNYSFKISREKAKKRNLNEEEIFNKNKEFSEKFNKFIKIWNIIKKDVIKYKCYPEMPIKSLSSSDTLAYYLNDDKELGYGMYFAALFENFIDWQNSFLNPIINSYESDGILHHYIHNINRKIPIQGAKNNQILLIEDSFSNSKYINLKDLIYTFSQRNIIYKDGKIDYNNYNSFIYDYDAIEEELGKMILPDLRLFKNENDLDFIIFSGELFKGKKSQILIDFYSKYTQKDLSNTEKQKIINSIKIINKDNYDFKDFYATLEMFIFYLTEIEIIDEEENILYLYERTSSFFQFSDNCKKYLMEIGKIKINKLINIFSIFEHLCFENFLKNLSFEYKIKIPENIVIKIKNKIINKEFNNNLYTIKELGSAVRRFISRYIIGNIQVIDINLTRDLSFELGREDLWKNNIPESEDIMNNLRNQLSEFELKIDQAYAFYEIIGEEDKKELELFK